MGCLPPRAAACAHRATASRRVPPWEGHGRTRGRLSASPAVGVWSTGQTPNPGARVAWSG
eukprot:661867-Rhodomonas_salina.1